MMPTEVASTPLAMEIRSEFFADIKNENLHRMINAI